MTSLMSRFTLATQRAEAARRSKPIPPIDGGETQIPVKDGNLPAYYARPATSTGFPVVLVNEEIFGVHEYIKDTCRRLAKLGYMAFAPELYARIADLSKMTDIPNRQRGNRKKPDDEMFSDLDATLDWAAKVRAALPRSPRRGSAVAVATPGSMPRTTRT